MLKITVKNDFRNQKAGDVYNFDLIDKIGLTTLVGENGSGKSTILQVIRGSVKSNTKSLYEADYKLIALNVEIEHNYEQILFFDAIKDNGNDFMNAYDASNYINSGGFYSQNLSHGQSALMYIKKFMNENEKKIIPGKTLVVFDEIDNGLSLTNLSKFINFINKLQVIKKCHILIASHNPFFIVQSVICFDVMAKEYTSSSAYVEKMTGYKLTKVEINDL